MVEERIYIYKIPMDKIIGHNYNIEGYAEEEAIVSGELVPISESQLTWKIRDYYAENALDFMRVRDAIINIVVPSASGKQSKKVAAAYRELAYSGFNFNKRHYVRLCAGSGQLRHNTVTYVWDMMYRYLTEALYCGISPKDLGCDFSVSKWNAYVGLSESGMHFIKSSPRVCIVSDYEVIKPHLPVDYIETVQAGGRKKTGKTITRYYYDDSKMDFAPLNSFDGQGLADPDWMKKVAVELGYLKESNGYVPSEYIIRAPWCKGLVVAFDFKAYCRESGVTSITDVYGQTYNVEDIDLLLSTSQFKMWKVYGKFGGWKYHQESMKKYNLKWGVVIANREKDDDFRALNYQYIQALDLNDRDIDELCKHTEDLLTKLCSGHIETVYRTLVGYQGLANDDALSENMNDDNMTIAQPLSSASLLQKAVAHNYDLLNDAHIQTLIYREAESKFNGAKIGKLLCRGGYSFIVSDPVAQIQHIIQSHAVDGNKDIEVSGLIPAKKIYSAYWNHVCDAQSNIVLMRSPLVDSSEVTVCGLARTPEMDKWYSHIKSGLVLSIFDLNTLALQNCDFDGDRCFSSNNKILIKGAQENPVPILYPSAGAQLKGVISFDSMVDADIRGLNSAVGTLSNQATCLYALRAKYHKGSPEYEELSRRIKIVSELVGVEIDKIKTGIPPMKPSDWNKERIPYEQFNDVNGDNTTVKVPACSYDEQIRILRHNALIPEYKPLFMRYIYPAMDKDLVKYDKAFDSASKYNDGIRLIDLLSEDYDSLSEDDKRTVNRYHRHLPAIDAPCTMNKICRRFELLQKELKHHKGTRNMLLDFATEQPIDKDILHRIGEAVDMFQRQKRFITKSNNLTNVNSNKQIAKDTKEQFNILHTYIRDQILELTDGDIQSAYNYMSELMRHSKCSESTVWAILDDAILSIIPAKSYEREVAA